MYINTRPATPLTQYAHKYIPGLLHLRCNMYICIYTRPGTLCCTGNTTRYIDVVLCLQKNFLKNLSRCFAFIVVFLAPMWTKHKWEFMWMSPSGEKTTRCDSSFCPICGSSLCREIKETPEKLISSLFFWLLILQVELLCSILTKCKDSGRSNGFSCYSYTTT
jgi:hypothetical protein